MVNMVNLKNPRRLENQQKRTVVVIVLIVENALPSAEANAIVKAISLNQKAPNQIIYKQFINNFF
jgi:hypothetical protein